MPVMLMVMVMAENSLNIFFNLFILLFSNSLSIFFLFQLASLASIRFFFFFFDTDFRNVTKSPTKIKHMLLFILHSMAINTFYLSLSLFLLSLGAKSYKCGEKLFWLLQYIFSVLCF